MPGRNHTAIVTFVLLVGMVVVAHGLRAQDAGYPPPPGPYPLDTPTHATPAAADLDPATPTAATSSRPPGLLAPDSQAGEGNFRSATADQLFGSPPPARGARPADRPTSMGYVPDFNGYYRYPGHNQYLPTDGPGGYRRARPPPGPPPATAPRFRPYGRPPGR